ncbi:hypothetical protein BHC44_07960 [Snodgrassella alvi]|uniref:hypothetical protein n=1 Tax=Snodgrassella alvi TaxID=1196083 RepID=UPI000C1DE7B9|nr:hypothetical protein [Snodgrassella alvi]PIT52167.1 hypothetical protein BHC44_07960 [Snodgrassella alvi]
MLSKHPNGFWYIDIQTESDKTIRRSTKTKNERLAEEYHDKLKHGLWQQERLGDKPKYLWDDAMLRWLDEKKGVRRV